MHHSRRTEEACVDWAKRFILYHNKRHPQEMGKQQIGEFLIYLAHDRQVSASTQNQVKAALLFLYKEVLEMPLSWLGQVEQVKKPQKKPVVLTESKVQALLSRLADTC